MTPTYQVLLRLPISAIWHVCDQIVIFPFKTYQLPQLQMRKCTTTEISEIAYKKIWRSYIFITVFFT